MLFWRGATFFEHFSIFAEIGQTLENQWKSPKNDSGDIFRKVHNWYIIIGYSTQFFDAVQHFCKNLDFHWKWPCAEKSKFEGQKVFLRYFSWGTQLVHNYRRWYILFWSGKNNLYQLYQFQIWLWFENLFIDNFQPNEELWKKTNIFS